MPLSIDLRKRVIVAIDNGMRPTEAAKVFGICRRTIYHWKHLIKASNNLAPKSGYQNGHSHKITDWDRFKSFVEANKQYASPHMRREWKELTGVDMSESAMLSALKKIGFTSKKKLLITPKQIKKNEKRF